MSAPDFGCGTGMASRKLSPGPGKIPAVDLPAESTNRFFRLQTGE
jgi:predicted TPR repeat methyltransferase